MNKRELGLHIWNFIKLNPKKNNYLNFQKYNQSSFFVMQSSFQENKKNIIVSNYDGIFYSKNERLLGKNWIDILLTSKNILEYHKRIRDEFPFCQQRNLAKILLNDLFYWFDKNIQNIIIEVSQANFDIEIRKKLEKIRLFLEIQDWSNYFFNLQKLMHEYIIKFLNWKGNFTYDNYSKILIKQLNNILTKYQVEQYLQFIQKLNLYRNTFSKVKASENNVNQELLKQWNNWNILVKKTQAWDLYYQLNNFINIINLFLQEKY